MPIIDFLALERIFSQNVSVYLIFESVLQGRGEVCCVNSAVIVDVGSKPQQKVDQLVVAQTQSNL